MAMQYLKSTHAPRQQQAGIWTRVGNPPGERTLGASTAFGHSTGALNVLPLITISESASLRFELTREKMRGYLWKRAAMYIVMADCR